MAQTTGHGGQDIVRVIVFAQVVQRHQPAVCTPDRRFIHADGHDVERTALGRDVSGDALAQHVLFQRDPLHFVAGLFGEFVGVALHPDHVAVVHGGDGDRLSKSAAAHDQGQGRRSVQ